MVGYFESVNIDERTNEEKLLNQINELKISIRIKDNQLLNAFQLIKNGKKIGHLKFDGFLKEMEFKRDHDGEHVKQLSADDMNSDNVTI